MLSKEVLPVPVCAVQFSRAGKICTALFIVAILVVDGAVLLTTWLA